MTWINWERENRLVFDLKAGLEAAMAEKEINIVVDRSDIRGFNDQNIKINKLAHRAISHHDLPILSTWYKYGQYEPHTEFTPDVFTPRTLEHHDFPETPSVPHRDYPSAREFKYFFTELDLKNIMEEDMYSFLERNYEEFAPPDLRTLYISNLHVLRLFDEIVADDDLPSNALHYNKQLIKHSAKLRSELIAHPLFDREAEDIVVDFLRSVRNVLTSAAEKDILNRDYQSFFTKAREWYHEYIWVIPALSISIEKAEGVIEEEFKSKGQEKLGETRPVASEKYEDLVDYLFESQLSPSAQGYYNVEKSLGDSLIELEKASLNP